MANQKSYLDTDSNRVWLPTMGAIWHVRDNDVIHDYADTRVSAADYGAGLQQALGATGQTSLLAGDKLIVGPGRFTFDALSCTVDDVEIIFHGTILEVTDAATFTNAILFQGDRVSLRGLRGLVGSAVTDFSTFLRFEGVDGDIDDIEVDGANVANAGAGNGIVITGNRCWLRNSSFKDMEGGDSFSGRGIYVASAADCIVEGCKSAGNNYTGMRVSNANRFTLRRTLFYNNDIRGLEVDGSVLGSAEFFKLEHVTSLVDSNAASGAQAFLNLDTGFTYNHCVIDNVHVIDDDQISPGVSFNVPGSQVQQMKFGEPGVPFAKEIAITNSHFRHGDNSTNTVYGIAFDANPDRLQLLNNVFSGGIGIHASRFEEFHCEGNHFGIDDINNPIWMFRWLPAGRVTIKNNIFDSGTTNTQVFEDDSAAAQSNDYLRLLDNVFRGSNASDINLLEEPPNIVSDPRCVVSQGNSYNNFGGGSFIISSDANAYLMLHTDRNGDMLYDSADGSMPSPGTHPNYFGSVPGILGQKIWNTKFAGAGIQYWSYDGSDWIAKTQTLDVIEGDSLLGATPSIDFSSSNHRSGVLNADITGWTFTGPDIESKLMWILIQNSTGGWTVNSWSGMPFYGSTRPVIGTAADEITVIEMYWDGTNLHRIGGVPWA